MEPEKRKEPAEASPPPAESPSQPPLSEGEVAHPPEKEPYRPYSRSTRIKAWIRIAFMVFLVSWHSMPCLGKIMARFEVETNDRGAKETSFKAGG